MSGNKQVSEVQKKASLASSGYDYYWTLYKAIALHAGGAPTDEIESVLLSAASPTEATNNRAAYEVFRGRFGSKKNIAPIKRSISRHYENGVLEIVFNPLFQVEDKRGINVYSVWAIQNPELEQGYAAMACYLIKEAYRKTTLANSQFFFFDLVSDRVYSERQITNSTSVVAKVELSKLAEIIKQVEN